MASAPNYGGLTRYDYQLERLKVRLAKRAEDNFLVLKLLETAAPRDPCARCGCTGQHHGTMGCHNYQPRLVP